MSTIETEEFDDIRVLVIADDPLARAGLATLLAGKPGCMVVGQVAGNVLTAGNSTDALTLYQPDVLLWDSGWDSANTLEHLNDLEDGDHPPIIILLGDDEDIETTLNMISSELHGLLRRTVDAATLHAAINAVAHGLAVTDPDLTDSLTPTPGPPDISLPPLAEPLTPRELEVLQLVAEGLSNKMIARQLVISDHTVKFHINALMGKLDAQSRTEAVVKAMRLGLITL